MASTYDEIMNAALSLPPGARAMLAEHLLESLDAPDQKEIDAIWAEQVEKRIQEVDEGKVEAIPGEQVLSDLRSRGK
ncbi:MAG TPA: addiction module protein [Blastocatellia bacterium]|nr:addiction module protein [Blastocatellia bacterium]